MWIWGTFPVGTEMERYVAGWVQELNTQSCGHSFNWHHHVNDISAGFTNLGCFRFTQ